MEKVNISLLNILNNKTNDYIKPIFFLNVLEFIAKKPILTEIGKNHLHNFDLTASFGLLKLQPMHQRTLIKTMLYLTMCFNLATLFMGLTLSLEDKSNTYGLSDEIVDYIKSTIDSTYALINDYKVTIEHWQQNMLDKYCKMYNQEKSRLYHGNPFNVQLHLPSMVPEEARNAQECK